MSKRLFATVLLSCSFLFVPALAAADDVPTDTPVATDAPSPTATPDPAAGLGPQSTSSAGGAKTDYTLLQPAGSSNDPLQSNGGDSTGLTAPNANTLQMPATNEQTLRVLDGEADGGPVPMDPTPKTDFSWLWFTLGFAVLVAAGTWLTRRARWARPYHRLLQRVFAWEQD